MKRNGWSGLALVAVLGLAACAPRASRWRMRARPKARLSTAPAKTLVSTIPEGEIVPVLQQAESELEAKPSALDAVASLQETLTTVYRQVNPSVVYIVVSANTGLRVCRRRVVADSSTDEEGCIITNSHVVSSGDSFGSSLLQRRASESGAGGADPDSDLAVLKVASLPDGVVSLPLAQNPVEVGQFAVALGSPLASRAR